ncbi:hypothetical protein F8388_013736 [Cannabis sativa]|uniref:Transposase-associated domain-containing protein n=1 Tax=Cannabis sativa TaxID=3483 RepID=A0A7J6HSN8_CANSA|nr:hypothetical protein F8388_013736 [Cannabis sativa]KAF4398302.1 hypothetical protein G4B88_007581 [Cannabis sativa]
MKKEAYIKPLNKEKTLHFTILTPPLPSQISTSSNFAYMNETLTLLKALSSYKRSLELDFMYPIEYAAGMNEFISVARHSMDSNGMVLCPCCRCVNKKSQYMHVIKLHLITHGFLSSYTRWYHHGEQIEEVEDEGLFDTEDNVEDSNHDDLDASLHDDIGSKYFDIGPTSDFNDESPFNVDDNFHFQEGNVSCLEGLTEHWNFINHVSRVPEFSGVGARLHLVMLLSVVVDSLSFIHNNKGKASRQFLPRIRSNLFDLVLLFLIGVDSPQITVISVIRCKTFVLSAYLV